MAGVRWGLEKSFLSLAIEKGMHSNAQLRPNALLTMLRRLPFLPCQGSMFTEYCGKGMNNNRNTDCLVINALAVVLVLSSRM